MGMRRFGLADEFIKPDLERAVIAAIAHAGDEVFWKVCDVLPIPAFAAEAETWAQLRTAFELDREQPPIPPDWQAANSLLDAAHELASLFRRRIAATAVERISHDLHTGDPATLVIGFEEA